MRTLILAAVAALAASVAWIPHTADAIALAVVQQAQQVTDSPTFATALQAVGAICTSGLLSLAKKTDLSIVKAPLFRKLQPVITLAGALVTPWAAARLGAPVDLSTLGQAPAITLATVVGAELLAILRRST